MDKLIKDIITDRRIYNCISNRYEYIGELLIIDEEHLVRYTPGINKKSLIIINHLLHKAGYERIGSMVSEAHRLPSTVLQHMALKAAEREDRAREEAEEFIREHGYPREEHLDRLIKKWEEEKEKEED